MKIRVISATEIFKYFIKVSLIFVTMSIIINFFSKNRVENNFLKIDSTALIKAIDREIILFSKNSKTVQSADYSKQSFNSELNVLKLVATNDINNLKVNAQGTLAQNNTNSQESSDLENGNNINTLENSIENISDTQNIQDTQNTQNLQEPLTNVTTEVLPSNVIDKCTYEIFGAKIRNESDYDLSAEITDLNVDINKQDIMIFHTHTCESYTETEACQYEESGTFRTIDLNYSVSRVGDELEKYLTNYGYTVVHDKTYHDYPAYNGSYDRSLQTVKNLLGIYTNTDVVIDLHRDAIGDNTYAPTVKIGDEYCARIMLVIGTDGGGLAHQNWRDNLKFAIKLQQKAEELYPGLFKPIIVRNSRYNHHLASGACIIEVGATGNTLEQCLNSMKYLAKIYNEM